MCEIKQIIAFYETLFPFFFLQLFPFNKKINRHTYFFMQLTLKISFKSISQKCDIFFHAYYVDHCKDIF